MTAMGEHRNIDYPAIMSAPMVRALLREVTAPGTGKRMTRRLAWKDGPCFGEATAPSPWQKVRPGELWVREAVEIMAHTISRCSVTYLADSARRQNLLTPVGTLYQSSSRRSSIHMPRWASRLTLTVTATKIERLQDISEEEAESEGAMPSPGGMWSAAEGQGATSARAAFALLWNSLHGAGAWEANPEVVALAFTVELRNIDAPREAA